jgi:hypothetical protein
MAQHFCNIFSNLFFQSPRYEEFFRNNFKILYCPNITPHYSTASLAVWLWHLTINERFGVRLPVKSLTFFNKALNTMQFQIFICNNQELSKCSHSKIYLVKYLIFVEQTNIMRVNCVPKCREILYIIEECCVCPSYQINVFCLFVVLMRSFFLLLLL